MRGWPVLSIYIKKIAVFSGQGRKGRGENAGKKTYKFRQGRKEAPEPIEGLFFWVEERQLRRKEV